MNFIALHNRIQHHPEKITIKEFDDIRAVLLRMKSEAVHNTYGQQEAAKRALADIFIILADYQAESEQWTPTEIF